MSDIRLNLRDSKTGKFKEHVQSFIPMRKAIEYAQKEAELDKKHKGNIPQSELDSMRIRFVADLFDDDKITEEYILDGLDAEEAYVIMDIILERVLGVDITERKKLREKPEMET